MQAPKRIFGQANSTGVKTSPSFYNTFVPIWVAIAPVLSFKQEKTHYSSLRILHLAALEHNATSLEFCTGSSLLRTGR
jgi:hypothetical protein